MDFDDYLYLEKSMDDEHISKHCRSDEGEMMIRGPEGRNEKQWEPDSIQMIRRRRWLKQLNDQERHRAVGSDDDANDNKSVFVSQLSMEANIRDIYDFFSKAGKVRDIRLLHGRNSTCSEGSGYIDFHHAESVQLAVDLSGELLLGHEVLVIPSEDVKTSLQRNVSSGVNSMELDAEYLHCKINDDQLPQDNIQPPYSLATGESLAPAPHLLASPPAAPLALSQPHHCFLSPRHKKTQLEGDPMSAPLLPPSPLSPGLRQKRPLEDAATTDPKRMKSMGFIPVLEFFAKFPHTKEYRYKVGSEFGNISKRSRWLTTRYGQLTVDGFIEELRAAHKKGRSWGGAFDVKNMFVSTEGPLCVEIDKEPEVEASDENVNEDLLQLLRSLLLRFGEEGNRPPYFEDLIQRIQDLEKDPRIQDLEEDPKVLEKKKKDREALLWLIENHPAFIDSLIRRAFFHEFYVFYKTIPGDVRQVFIEEINLPSNRRWHLVIVPTDDFLSKFYWHGRTQKQPKDFLWRSPNDERLDDEHPTVYPFTSSDSYLAVFLRHFIVHGPQAAIVTWKLKDVTLEEQELIIAHYFRNFLPNFLIQIYKFQDRYDLIGEIIDNYCTRRRISWKAYQKDEDQTDEGKGG